MRIGYLEVIWLSDVRVLGPGHPPRVTFQLAPFSVTRSVRIITSNYGMAEALTGIDKKQDAEAISRRIHEKGSIRVFERRREDRAT